MIRHSSSGEPGIVSRVVNVDIGSIPATNTLDTTVTVLGARTVDQVSVSPIAPLPAGSAMCEAWCQTDDQVTIRSINLTGAPVDPGAQGMLFTIVKDNP